MTQRFPRLRFYRTDLWGVRVQRNHYDEWDENPDWGRRRTAVTVALLPTLAFELYWWYRGRDGR